MSEEIQYIELSDKRCYICGRSENDLKKINEKIFKNYNGEIKDYYSKIFRIRLEKKEIPSPVLFHNDSDDIISWGKKYKSDEWEYLFHPNEVIDQWVQLGLKYGILKITFIKKDGELFPQIELTGIKPSDSQMMEFKKVDKNNWLTYAIDMDSAREDLIRNLRSYCQENKHDPSKQFSKYLKGGLLKQFAVNLKIYVCTICSFVQLPGIRIDDNDEDDGGGGRNYSEGFEYSAIDQDNWGDL